VLRCPASGQAGQDKLDACKLYSGKLGDGPVHVLEKDTQLKPEVAAAVQIVDKRVECVPDVS